MGYSSAWGDDFAIEPSVDPGVRAAERSLGGRSKLLGIVIAITTAQAFLYLVYVDQSPLIPGSLNGYGPSILFYLLLTSVVTLPIIGFAPNLKESRTYVNLATGGSVFRFMANFAITGFLAWALMSLILTGIHASYTTVSGADRLSGLIILSLVVAASEELCFRVALPLVGPWLVMSGFVFALFHLAVDSATIGLSDASGIASAFIQRFIAGIVLFVIYRYSGLGSCVAAHFVYDATISGYLGSGFPISLAHAGLVPV